MESVDCEGSLELVFHCNARDKTRGLGLGKRKKGGLFVPVF